MKITILNAPGRFDGLQEIIETVSSDTSSKLRALFDLKQLDVTISAYSKGEAPVSGIGGWAINSYRIEILLDAEREDIREVIEAELPAVLAHEVNHIERMKLKLPVETLAEHLINEGLACHFEKEFNGDELPSLFKEIQEHCWKDMFTKMKPHLANKEFHFPTFFYSGENENFPKYAGYWVGFNLVVDYLTKTGINEKEALALPSEAFFG